MNPILSKLLDFGLNFLVSKVEDLLEKETVKKNPEVKVETPSLPVRPKPPEENLAGIPPRVEPIYTSPLRFGDGRGGLLYKLSETRNAEPVVLLPGGFTASFVQIQGVKGTFDFAKGDFANPEANGILRQHWRSGKSVNEIERIVGKRSPYFLIICDEDDGSITRLKMGSLKNRID